MCTAKLLIRLYIEMVKRPIAHYDPALATAHVMLWNRAPFNPTEKQTAILLRDMVANVSKHACHPPHLL